MGCLFLLQSIFPSQGWDPGLPHCRQAPYHLSHQGSHINLTPALTEVHFSSFSTTTPRGEPVFIQRPHLHSAQLHTSPLYLTSTPVLSGPPVTPSWHAQWTLSRSPVIVCQHHSISCITPSFVKSSFIFTSHPPTCPNRPPTPLATLIPKCVSHQVDFTCYILSLESFNHSHG